MNFIIIFVLSLLNLSPVDSTAQTNEPNGVLAKDVTGVDTYCNTRFDFCIEYPSDIFIAQTTPANADGIFLRTPNNEVTMTVYGEYNALGYSNQEQHEFLLKTLSEKDQFIADHLTIFSDHGFTMTAESQNKKIEVRCQQIGNNFVTVIIRMNEKDNPKYLKVNSEIKIKITI